MNKHRYRLIFNCSRGLMMAVAEHVSACRNTPSTLAGHADPIPMQWLANISTLRLSLMFMLGAAVIIATSARADIIADPAAPASQQPVISNTANGLPLVNIQTPSAAGVSRNTYSQFDVNAHGAILNNSNTNVQTQLGGWVQGNPYLANGTARVILNEVNSSNPSLLNGFIEIAGSRAQLVIANPAGISCNGCGFINANRATLTTGTPIMNSGNLMGYRVGGGSISFLGQGMDASHADYTDVITQAVEVNAGIWANDLNVMTGNNQVNVDSTGQQTSITPITPTTTTHPAFAVDVAALGGMYAGKIHLIGTEAGLGVRNAGAMGASVGEVIITHDGHITNRGSISAQTILHIQATGAVDNTQGTLAAKDSLALQSSSLDNTGGTITSHQAANINTGGLVNTHGSLRAEGNLMINSTSLTGDGDLLSQANMHINTYGDIDNIGHMIANGDLQLITDGHLTNNSQLEAGQALAITAQSLDNKTNSTIIAGNTSLRLIDTLTNRGLIDSSNTFIHANTIQNIGTARLYGDHIALQANNLVNRAETINGTTTAATIAARDQLDLGIETLTNQQGATIFSAGDLAIGAGLDTDHLATGKSLSILNESASIEALGNISITSENLTNQRSSFSMERLYVGSSTTRDQVCVDVGKCSYIDHMTYQRTEYEDQITSNSPIASILAGANAHFTVNTLSNFYSNIEAGNNLNLTGNILLNQGAELFHQTDLITTRNRIHWGDRDHGTWVTSSSSSTLIDTIPSIISAGGTLTGTFTDRIDNTTIREQTAPINNPSSSTPAATAPISITPSLTSSLFHPAPSITSHYLIETDPTFANYHQWLSSDYMVQQLAFDPAITQKRLGDGFYEQRLVREQVAQLTGKRFLEGYANDEAQYQALMSAGLTQVNELQLIPGVALSPAQIAQLTSDIVWLVEQEVTLPDGSVTKALVPQVYVRLNDNDIAPSGAVLAGNSVNLNVDHGDINTSGTIAGRNVVNISADNINNVRGFITGTHVALTANDNINIEGGSVAATDSLIAQAGNNLTVQSSTTALDVRMAGTANRVQSQVIDRVAGLYVSNPDAVLVASAGNDLNLMAAAIQNTGASGQTLLQAGNNLNIGTVETTTDSYATGRKSWRKEQSSTEVGSNIATNGDITLKAGNNLEVKASGISSEAGNLNASAGGDLTITAGTNTLTSEAYRKVKTTSRKKEYRDTLNETTRTGSTLSAENITLQAGTGSTGNLAIEGSNVVSTNGTTLQATGDITIASVDNIHDETHTKKEKKSGFSGGGSSIGYGTSKLSQKQTGTTVTQTGSTVGSVEGDVSIQAGHTYTQTASDVLTPNGDIDIEAQQVNITAGNNTSTQTTETKYKQSGLTLAITSPVISAIQTANQMKDAASNTSDGRMQALAAGTTALAASNAYDSTMQALNAAPSGSNITDAGNQAGGVNLSLSIGTSKSSSTSTQTISTAQGSSVIAGGDVSIKATGAGEQSDMNVVGSTIKADGDISLKADDEVNLLAAQNTDTLKNKNKNSSASIGISIGSNGLAITASASQGKGKANGTDVTWTESMVQAGNKVNLESGTNTNVIGSQVKGEQVIANVGTSGAGNLNIQSLQDTSTYDSKQKSTGISISVPIGAGMAGGSFSSSSSKINSDYASVKEQAGIYAGDGGFQVNVNGHTDLKGAVIASTETAITENRNSLVTETLTVSNIENQAEYDAKASSATIGGGIQAGLPQLSGAGVGSDSDQASSTTVSAVSGGVVNITNDSAQATIIALLNRDVVVDEHGNAVDNQGNSTANTIAPIFDAEKVAKEIQAQVQITEAFGQQAHYAVGQYVQGKRQALQQQLKEAATPEEKSIIQSQLKDLRLQEQVMNVLIAAVTGQLDTALGKEALSAAAEKMREITIANSSLFKGITDGNTVLNNTSGESEGVRGDGIKGGGTRVNLDNICGTDNARCETRIDENGNNVLDLKDGMVQWKATNTISLAEFLASPEGQQAAGATGGIQGWIGTLFGTEYQPGSWQDQLIEAFGGTHDYIGGQVTGLYDEQGNTKRGMDSTERFIRDRVSELAILPSTPFAMAELLPPEVWTAISALLKGAK
ncbi:two-partner secretion domain-containing protein [Methylobacillus methanolivorans]